MTIKLRPHQFICTIGFQGNSYTSGFNDNYLEIKKRLEDNPETLVEVSDLNGDICSACPNQITSHHCSNSTFGKLDKKHKEVLELTTGQVLSWAEAKQRIKDKMSIGDFHYACEGCHRREQGNCQRALEKLIRERA